MTQLGFWLGLLSVLVFSCNLSGEPTSPPAGSKSPTIDACSLATREEVGAIQGAKMLDPQSSEGPASDFQLSQCYYASAEPDRSVSVGLMQRDPKDSGTRTITQFWHETFDRFASGETGKEAEQKRPENNDEDGEEHEGMHPQKIEALGEASYWLGNPM